jgi:hypothetical protein
LLTGGNQPSAAPAHRISPACVAQVRSRLLGPEKSTSLRPTRIKGRHLGGKRLVFHRGEALLIIDHAALQSAALSLETAGFGRTAEQTAMLRHFRERLASTDEAEIDTANRTIAIVARRGGGRADGAGT